MFERVFAGIFVYVEVKGFLLLLAPFDNQAFVTDDLALELFDVDVGIVNDLFMDEFAAVVIPSVHVDGPDQSFENVTVYVFAKVGFRDAAFHEMNQPEVFAQLVEVLAAYDFGAHFGQIALVAFGHFAVKVTGYNGAEHGIAQKLEPLIVDGVALFILFIDRPMQKSLFCRRLIF